VTLATDATAGGAGAAVADEARRGGTGTDERPDGRGERAARGAAALSIAFAIYLALAVALWWHVWSAHPSATAPCGCGDPAMTTWFLAWPAAALQHGWSPFFSSAMFHPLGINLLANTGTFALGLPLAPVTWVFGPVATLNVLASLAPALSALAMCWLLRRWVTWMPAAFAGGLLYGFSPFVVDNLAMSHLMISWLVVPPLIVACLDELLVRRRHSPANVGLVLGVLVVVQFFVSTEVLAILAIVALAALAVLGVAGVLGARSSVRARALDAAKGLGTAAGVVVAALAYPTWFALDGRAHLSGQVWGAMIPAGFGGANPPAVLWRSFPSQGLIRISGYGGAPLPAAEYLGPGILAVIVLGLVAFRRDRKLWFFTALGLVAFVLSIGVNTTSWWVPWDALVRLPVVHNIIPGRFVIVVALCAAVVVGLVVDHAHEAVGGWAARRVGRDVRRPAPALGLPRLLGAGAGVLVAVIAVAPVVRALGPEMPLAVRPVVVPAWFAAAPPSYRAGDVVLAYPFAAAPQDPVAAWQAIDGMRFAVAEGGGPGDIASRQGRDRPGFETLYDVSWAFAPPADAAPATLGSLRLALADWGVTTVVVPDQGALPPAERGAHPALAVALITAATGRAPVLEHDALVWRSLRAPDTPHPLAASALARCAGGGDAVDPGALAGVAACVLDPGGGG